jgi:hypothetical protein
MARSLGSVGLSTALALALSACGPAGGQGGSAPAENAAAASGTAGQGGDAPQLTQTPPPNPDAPQPEPGQTNAQARAEDQLGIPQKGASPTPNAVEGASAEDVSAARSPEEAAKAAGGGDVGSRIPQ